MKSLSQLLEEVAIHATNFPPPPNVCHAVICLNGDDKEAKADDHIASIGRCLSTRFIWSEEDKRLIYANCWTPKKKDEPNEHSRTI